MEDFQNLSPKERMGSVFFALYTELRDKGWTPERVKEESIYIHPALVDIFEKVYKK